MPDPRTTIVIPTYNRGAMVIEAVRAALAQTVDVDLIVVDDGSTDDTLTRLSSLLSESVGASFKVIPQPNRERGAARNRGAQAFDETEFLLFLDADDSLLPDHVETLERLADQNPQAPLVTSAFLVCDEHLRPFDQVGGEDGPVSLERFLLGKETVSPPATLVRRTAFREVGGFDEDRALSGSEDWLLNACLLCVGDGVRSSRATALVRKHEGNSMAHAPKMLASMLLAHERFFADREGILPARATALRSAAKAILLLQASTQFYATGEGRTARRKLREAARIAPGVLVRPLWAYTYLRSLVPYTWMRRLRDWKRRRQSRS